MLDARTIRGGNVHIRRTSPSFMGYNNNMAPLYWPDIYGKFISFYAATHSRATGVVGCDVLALIVGNLVGHPSIKY